MTEIISKTKLTDAELSLIDKVLNTRLSFEKQTLSAEFTPKTEQITEHDWQQAMVVLHPILPLRMTEKNAQTVYVSAYEDEQSLRTSVEIYTQLQDYKEAKKNNSLDRLYYFSSANKKAHMERLHQFFNPVRFSTANDAPYWYAFELANAEREEAAYNVLSRYIKPVRMELEHPQLFFQETIIEAPSDYSHIYYDFGKDAYPFFQKIARDLENYQKKMFEDDRPTIQWEPKRLFAHGLVVCKDHVKGR